MLDDVFDVPFGQIGEMVGRSEQAARQLAVFSPVVVNGVAGILITFRGRPVSLIACTVSGGRITALDGITDLDRLRHLGLDRLAPEG